MYCRVEDLKPEQLYEYLAARHGYSRAFVDWKYLDARGPQGGTRGLAWVREGRIDGFVGLIPFRVQCGESALQASWSCDWSLADPSSTPGMGVMLLKRAIRRAGLVATLGGNANTRKALPRIANHTVEDAATLHLTILRVGAVLEPALRGTPLAALAGIAGRLPARLARPPKSAVRVTEGVDPSVAPLLDALAHDDRWTPAYTTDYLDWLVGACPEYTSFTAWSPGAFVLAWGYRSDARRWRVAVFKRPGADGAVVDCLRRAHQVMMRRGGERVEIMVGDGDSSLLHTVRSLGYLKRGPSLPQYLSSSKKTPWPCTDLKDPRLVDTDLIHLF